MPVGSGLLITRDIKKLWHTTCNNNNWHQNKNFQRLCKLNMKKIVQYLHRIALKFLWIALNFALHMIKLRL